MRHIPHLRDTRLIIIAAEGTTTEKTYFESSLFHNHRVQVRVIEAQNNLSAPNHVLDRLKSFAKVIDFQSNNRLWFMVDKDRWPDKQLSEICSCAIRGNLKADLAISNPCFELWLYLHHAAWTQGAVSSKEMTGNLRALLGGYKKARLDIESFRDSIDIATQRAKALDKNPKGRWPENPGTHVYKVIEAIRELKR